MRLPYNFCDFSNENGQCCNSPPEYELITEDKGKQVLCSRHLWYLYDEEKDKALYL